MAFHHLAGTTTPGAPDPVVDWFATFQAWITGTVGWIVAAGGGTTNLYIRSLGELGGLTMLYAHIWRDGVNPNLVHVEVSDDTVPTHTTAEGGTLNTGGVQFSFWMSADLDAFVLVFKVGAGYNAIYAGLVMPFALTVPDETYSSIVTNNRLDQGSILRNHNNVWDVDANLYWNTFIEDAELDRFDVDGLPLGGRFFNNQTSIAGQLRHVSGPIDAGGIAPEDTLQTGLAPATTTWIVLCDSVNRNFALRTGGVLPTGQPDGAHFAHQAGNAANGAALLATISLFLQGVGWADLGPAPGLPGSLLFYSQGESGTEDIYVALQWNGGWWWQYVQDDAAGTHRTTQISLNFAFPANYWISADRDCMVYTVQQVANYYPWFAGMVLPYVPGIYAPGLSPYKVISIRSIYQTGAYAVHGRLLLSHDGATWDLQIGTGHEGANINPSNPNSFDGTTYLVWPVIALYDLAIGGFEITGLCKYLMYSNGGGIASLDTITVAGHVYTVFYYGVNVWAMRTV